MSALQTDVAAASEEFGFKILFDASLALFIILFFPPLVSQYTQKFLCREPTLKLQDSIQRAFDFPSRFNRVSMSTELTTTI